MSDSSCAGKLLMLGVDPIPTKISKTTGKEAVRLRQDRQGIQGTARTRRARWCRRWWRRGSVTSRRWRRRAPSGCWRSAASATSCRCRSNTPAPTPIDSVGTGSINLQNLPRGGELRKRVQGTDGQEGGGGRRQPDRGALQRRTVWRDTAGRCLPRGPRRLCRVRRADLRLRDRQAQALEASASSARPPILSLGYGSSWPVFQNMCRNTGNVILTDNEAVRIVSLYRTMFPNIVAQLVGRQQQDPAAAGAGTIADRRDRQADGAGARRHVGAAETLSSCHRCCPTTTACATSTCSQEVVDGYLEWRYERGRFDAEDLRRQAGRERHPGAGLHPHHGDGDQGQAGHRRHVMPVHQVHDELIFLARRARRHPGDGAGDLRDEPVPRLDADVPLAAEGHIGATYLTRNRTPPGSGLQAQPWRSTGGRVVPATRLGSVFFRVTRSNRETRQDRRL